MSKYTWIVTYDHLDKKNVHVIGPRGASLEGSMVVSIGKKFRMLDDDGEVYYSGYIAGEYDGFEPLDDYGMPNAGCVSIEYFEKGHWEVL